jgi:hypothetical protein
LLVGQRIVSWEVSSFRFCGKDLRSKVLLCQTHPTKGVSNNVASSFDVGEFGSKLFDDEPPSHDALCIESLVDQILVVGEDFYLLPKKDVVVLLQGFDDAEQFSLSRGVSGLGWIQLSTVEGNRFPFLGDNCS